LLLDSATLIHLVCINLSEEDGRSKEKALPEKPGQRHVSLPITLT
jgi:hypothetical protein